MDKNQQQPRNTMQCMQGLSSLRRCDQLPYRAQTLALRVPLEATSSVFILLEHCTCHHLHPTSPTYTPPSSSLFYAVFVPLHLLHRLHPSSTPSSSVFYISLDLLHLATLRPTYGSSIAYGNNLRENLNKTISP